MAKMVWTEHVQRRYTNYASKRIDNWDKEIKAITKMQERKLKVTEIKMFC